MMMARSLVILLFIIPLAHAGEQNKGELMARATELVEKQVAAWKGNDARLQVIEESYLRDVFSNQTFVAVHFPLWPVARVPAEPLQSQNLFAVSDDRKVVHLPDSKKLEEFFKSTLKTQLNMDKTTRAWLRLRMEYIQDGYFKFKYLDKAEITGPGSSLTLMTGVVEVVPEAGNTGTFKSVLRFGRGDDFVGVTMEENKIRAGIRPRCQATLLLHPDPLVRAIVEQDLLVLGRYAYDYLLDQRARANEQLRREIDRIWQRIDDER
jgi:hypothetical protein